MIDVSLYMVKIECLRRYMEYWVNARYWNDRYIKFQLDNCVIIQPSRMIEIISFDECWEHYKTFFI